VRSVFSVTAPASPKAPTVGTLLTHVLVGIGGEFYRW